MIYALKGKLVNQNPTKFQVEEKDFDSILFTGTVNYLTNEESLTAT